MGVIAFFFVHNFRPQPLTSGAPGTDFCEPPCKSGWRAESAATIMSPQEDYPSATVVVVAGVVVGAVVVVAGAVVVIWEAVVGSVLVVWEAVVGAVVVVWEAVVGAVVVVWEAVVVVWEVVVGAVVEIIKSMMSPTSQFRLSRRQCYPTVLLLK